MGRVPATMIMVRAKSTFILVIMMPPTAIGSAAVRFYS